MRGQVISGHRGARGLEWGNGAVLFSGILQSKPSCTRFDPGIGRPSRAGGLGRPRSDFLSGKGAEDADTFFLKKGRRIIARSVVEDRDRIKYQPAAGELTLPKSIVDHIERGGAVPDSRGAAAANLAMTPPVIDTNTPIEIGAVHD